MGQKSSKERFHVYTDGSLFNDTRRMGTGWVIERESTGKYLPGNQRVATKGKLTSSLAEIYAVAIALTKIDKSSDVVVHTDDATLSAMINRGNYEQYIADAKNKPSRAEALTSLFQSVSKHKSVTSCYESMHDSEHMARAHRLSRAACDRQAPCEVREFA